MLGECWGSGRVIRQETADWGWNPCAGAWVVGSLLPQPTMQPLITPPDSQGFTRCPDS